MSQKIEVESTAELPQAMNVDALVVGVASEGPLSGAALALDRASSGTITKVRERGEFAGKVAEVLSLHALSGVSAPLVLLVGLGKPADWSITTACRAAGAAAKAIAAKARKSAAVYLVESVAPPIAEAMISSALVGCVGQDLHRASKNRNPLEKWYWAGVPGDVVRRGVIFGDSTNLTRRLVNEPPNVIYPESFAAEAKSVAEACGLSYVAEACGLSYEVWDEVKLEKERCGSLLGVAKGSSNPPRMVILNYVGAGKEAPTIALVGKGVTFDSGGLSIKPTEGMTTMKCDMAGAATVLGAMRAIAELKLPVNVVGYMGLVENMLSGNCLKLGDVLTARSGKTIEVLNTDAEGRLVLADVLDVAKERGAKKIVDLATLTGACVVALGTDVAGVMSNHEGFSNEFLEAAKRAGEPAWPLPMFRDFDEQIQSEIADIKNVGNGRWGGAITAAKFLEVFVGDIPWVHVDIAGPAFAEKPRAWIDGGASGCFVRTLVELCRAQA